MQCNCKCNSLVTSLPSHQVSIFTHVHSVHFSAFSLHNSMCVTSHQHAPHHGYNAVAGSVAQAAIYCARIGTRSQQNRSKRWVRWNIVGPYIPYGLFQTTGKTCAKFGSDRFRNVDLYKVQTNIETNKQTFIFIYKIIKYVNSFMHLLLHFIRFVSFYQKLPSQFMLLAVRDWHLYAHTSMWPSHSYLHVTLTLIPPCNPHTHTSMWPSHSYLHVTLTLIPPCDPHTHTSMWPSHSEYVNWVTRYNFDWGWCLRLPISIGHR